MRILMLFLIWVLVMAPVFAALPSDLVQANKLPAPEVLDISGTNPNVPMTFAKENNLTDIAGKMPDFGRYSSEGRGFEQNESDKSSMANSTLKWLEKDLPLTPSI